MLTIPLIRDFSKYKTIQYQLVCYNDMDVGHCQGSCMKPVSQVPQILYTICQTTKQILSYIPMYYHSLLFIASQCIHFLLTKFWIVTTIYRADKPFILTKYRLLTYRGVWPKDQIVSWIFVSWKYLIQIHGLPRSHAVKEHYMYITNSYTICSSINSKDSRQKEKEMGDHTMTFMHAHCIIWLWGLLILLWF